MKKKPRPASPAAPLRRPAETRPREPAKKRRPRTEVARSPADTRRLLHELQVHQIELEVQNEELQQARDEMEAGLEKFSDLYDFAPVGYFSLTHKGTIRQVNLTGATLIGIDRSLLVGRAFGRLVHADQRPAFGSFLHQVFTSQTKHSGDFALVREGRPPCFVTIEGQISPNGQECRAAVMDITARKRAGAQLALLWDAAEVLLSTDDPAAILRGLFDKIGPALGVDAYFNYMVAESDGGLRLASWAGIPEKSARAIERLEPGRALYGTDTSLRQPIHATCLQRSAAPEARLVKSFGLQVYSCHPLMSGGVQLGTLAYASRSRERFDPEDLAVLQTLSRYVATAYERGRSRESLRVSEERYRTLFNSMDEGYCILEMIFDARDKPVDWRYLEVNPSFAKHNGMHEATGRRIRELAPDLEPHWFEIYGRVALTGEPVRFESESKAMGGLWFDLFAFRVGGPESRKVAVLFTNVTERRRSRLSLLGSEVRYRRLFEAAKDGVLVIDPETRRITDANPFMVQLLGYRRDEFIGKELYEIGLFHDQAAAQEAFKQLRDVHEIRYDHLPLKATDGTRHPVEVVANLYDEDGRAVIQCNVRDITERRQMEDSLRKSEARFHAIIAQATAGIAELDLTGRFTLVNERFCAIVGRTATELLGLRAVDLTHPDDLAASTARFTDRARGRADFSMEKRYLRPDGSVVWVSNSVAWITDREDTPLGFVEISQDISDRKRLEAALRTSEAYFRELTQSLPIGVWTSSPDGRLDFINRHWLDYTGLTFTDHLKHSGAWVESLHPDDRDRVQHVVDSSLPGDVGYTLEARFRHAASNTYRWFLKRSVPVRDLDGRLQKRIGMCIDIDDLKRAQSILADHAGALEEQVRHRTVELRETIGELEAFSYSVSHDMRAPLRAMQGFAQLLLQENATRLDAGSVDQLRRINASAGRLDALINDVLTYSRLLRSEIVLQPVDLDALIRVVIATYPNLQANEAAITIEGPLPVVLGNEASLTQCLSNLLSNAVKFVAPGVPARVRIRADTIAGEHRLWIEDNGIGIAPRDHERIWKIFTQIGRAKDYPGTGIGLAIVRKAIERMNGTIGVESALGAGSKFWFRLHQE